MARAAAAAVPLAVLCCALALPAAVADGNAVAQPGDDNYWVTLQDIEPTEGSLSPSFTPDGKHFTVTVTQESITTLNVVLMLNILKYNPRHCPTILVDGKPIKYSPLDQVRADIPLGDYLGAIEKTVKIKVMDPSETGGNWLNFIHKERSHEYVLKVVKPPQYDRLVTPGSVVVKDGTGRVVSADPPFDPQDMQRTKLEYRMDQNWEGASLQFSCPAVHGVTQQYDGAPTPPGSVKKVDYRDGYASRIHATCSYSSAEFAKSVQRTYVLEFSRHVDSQEAASISAELMVLPSYGYCETASADDPDLEPEAEAAPKKFGEMAAATGFVCRMDRSRGMVVATFSSTSGTPFTQLIDRRTGERITMTNAIPTGISMTPERRHFTMEVAAGDISLTYPVVVIWPGKCDTLACPAGQATVPADPFAARVHMCLGETCAQRDLQHCCAGRAMCSTYTASCPVDQIVRPDGASVACKGTSCTLEDDRHTCCQTKTTTTTSATTTSKTTRTATTTRTSTMTSSTATTSTETSTASSSTQTNTASSTSTSTETRTETSTSTRTVSSSSTTSTSTVTSSTTTSTTPYCIEARVVYTPLDMAVPGSKGQERVNTTVEEDSHACQARCKATEGCTHFSFWLDFRHCHLQDANATRQEYGYGFEAGPPECLPEGVTVTTTTTNPMPFNQLCFQTGLLWTPLMGTPLYLEGGKEEEVISKCQKACANMAGCAHFFVEFTQNLCRFAGSDAVPTPGLLHTVSGPPVCGAVYNELSDFMLRKFDKVPARPVPSETEGRRRTGGSLRATAAGCFSVLCIASGLVAVYARRRAATWGAAAGTLLLDESAAE